MKRLILAGALATGLAQNPAIAQESNFVIKKGDVECGNFFVIADDLGSRVETRVRLCVKYGEPGKGYIDLRSKFNINGADVGVTEWTKCASEIITKRVDQIIKDSREDIVNRVGDAFIQDLGKELLSCSAVKT